MQSRVWAFLVEGESYSMRLRIRADLHVWEETPSWHRTYRSEMEDCIQLKNCDSLDQFLSQAIVPFIGTSA